MHYLPYYPSTLTNLLYGCIVKKNMKERCYIMEMHERIRDLRKNHLQLSQTAFGKKLGVSRSVINNIELNTLARPDQKLSLIKLMCKEFNVREEWLLDGMEPIFIQTPSSIMEQLREEFHLDPFAYSFVYEYLKLDEKKRNLFQCFFYNVLTGMNAGNPPTENSSDS